MIFNKTADCGSSIQEPSSFLDDIDVDADVFDEYSPYASAAKDSVIMNTPPTRPTVDKLTTDTNIVSDALMRALPMIRNESVLIQLATIIIDEGMVEYKDNAGQGFVVKQYRCNVCHNESQGGYGSIRHEADCAVKTALGFFDG